MGQCISSAKLAIDLQFYQEMGINYCVALFSVNGHCCSWMLTTLGNRYQLFPMKVLSTHEA